MRGKSHRCLGRYLIRHYMPGLSGLGRRAFLLGCIQPDRNPMTYLKGSIRHQWLRGHNFPNTRRYMHRVARHLEARPELSVLDYYRLGKLIHYTADAFTYAHNEGFPKSLAAHREYEVALQHHFLAYLHAPPVPEIPEAASIMDAITRYHREYCGLPVGVHTDTRFAFQACCCILAALFVKTPCA